MYFDYNVHMFQDCSQCCKLDIPFHIIGFKKQKQNTKTFLSEYSQQVDYFRCVSIQSNYMEWTRGCGVINGGHTKTFLNCKIKSFSHYDPLTLHKYTVFII